MIRLCLALILLAAPASAQVCLCLKCATGAYESYVAPAGSMKPLIEPGQCFIARTSVTAEDIVPGQVIVFRHPVHGRDFVKRIIATAGQTVQMWDGQLLINGVAVSRRPSTDYMQVMQPEGAVRNLPRCPTETAMGETCAIRRATETIGGISFDVLDLGPSAMDSSGVFTVPPDHVFVMGDHRDNSLDSRAPRAAGGIGMVPVENITGILHELR